MSTRKKNTCLADQRGSDVIDHGNDLALARGDYRKEFAALAERYRRGCKRMGLAYLPAIAMLLAGWLIPAFRETLLVIGFLLFFPPIVFAFFIPRLECPACHDALRANLQRFGSYCPNCGGDKLKPGNLLKAAECPDCGALSANGRYGTGYVTHGCTHCGVWLDDQGV